MLHVCIFSLYKHRRKFKASAHERTRVLHESADSLPTTIQNRRVVCSKRERTRHSSRLERSMPASETASRALRLPICMSGSSNVFVRSRLTALSLRDTSLFVADAPGLSLLTGRATYLQPRSRRLRRVGLLEHNGRAQHTERRAAQKVPKMLNSSICAAEAFRARAVHARRQTASDITAMSSRRCRPRCATPWLESKHQMHSCF